MFKKIKSIFVVDESPVESGGTSELDNLSTNTKPNPVPVDQKPIPTTPTAPPSNLGKGKPDAKFTDLLLKSIEAGNLDGFDYLEFKNSLKSIESVIPDEGMRYKSAYEMAKTMGLTKEKLIQSASHYLGILTTEDKKFKEALENQKAKQIQGRSDQLSAIEKSIVEKQKMIETLTKEIETSTQQLSAVRSEINDAVVKIDVTNEQFVSSYNLVYGQIYQDIEKIKTNL